MLNRYSRVIVAIAACFVIASGAALARTAEPDEIRTADLPPQARQTLDTIRQNGPFSFSRDGIVFGNRERALPARSRGYYHEYTVRTPGTRGRGARRIVCGGNQSSIAECYYSDDHYQTFRRIR